MLVDPLAIAATVDHLQARAVIEHFHAVHFARRIAHADASFGNAVAELAVRIVSKTFARVTKRVCATQMLPDLGRRRTFADIGQTVAEFLGVPALGAGTSFLPEVWLD